VKDLRDYLMYLSWLNGLLICMKISANVQPYVFMTFILQG